MLKPSAKIALKPICFQCASPNGCYMKGKVRDMFVCSVRASTLKFFGFVILTLALLVGAVIYSGGGSVFAVSGATEINYEGIKTNEDRVKFIENFGVAVKDTPTEEQTFSMPDNFDRVIAGYNEVQKKQGLSLDKYAGKRVTRYTYEVTNYNATDGVVYVNLFVWRQRIIACDICSASPDAFLEPLTLVDTSKLDKIDKQ